MSKTHKRLALIIANSEFGDPKLSRLATPGRDAEALVRFDSGDVDAPAGGGESRRDVARRARRALLVIGRENASRRLAVVTHSGVIRSLLPDVRVANAEWHIAPLGEIAGVDRGKP